MEPSINMAATNFDVQRKPDDSEKLYGEILMADIVTDVAELRENYDYLPFATSAEQTTAAARQLEVRYTEKLINDGRLWIEDANKSHILY